MGVLLADPILGGVVSICSSYTAGGVESFLYVVVAVLKKPMDVWVGMRQRLQVY